MKITVYGGASNQINPTFIEKGESFGRKLVTRGHQLVYGGGAHGCMGAVARGVKEKNGHITGIAPTFFKEVDGELFEDCDEFIFTESMRERKYLLEEHADAFVVFPGGAGTFEELFEAITLKQLNQHNKAIVIYNVDGYYDMMEKLLMEAIEKRFIRESNLDLFVFLKNESDVFDFLENYKEERQFKHYRVG